MLRAGFYIDGFNVYGAICELKQDHLKWLSYRTLCEFIAANPQKISPRNGHGPFQEAAAVECIKLYTAVPSHNPARASRHEEYLKACRAQGIQVELGKFKVHDIHCRACKTNSPRREEKESDVHLAIDIVADALAGRIDIAFILTCDSDIAPAFRLVKQEVAVKLVTVAFEPRKHSFELAAEAHGSLYIKKAALERNLLPAQLVAPDGRTVLANRPGHYAPPPNP